MTSSSSKTETPRESPEQVVVGTVLRPHGVRGALVVELLSDVPGRFAPGTELQLVAPGAPRRSVRVAASGPYKGGLRVELEGVGGRDEAERLRGARFEIPAAAVGELPEGEFFHFELVGCRCVDRRAGEIGQVERVVEDAGGWLIVVALPGGERVPLPFVERFLLGVDRVARRIDWDLPEGLIESCASRS